LPRLCSASAAHTNRRHEQHTRRTGVLPGSPSGSRRAHPLGHAAIAN
jgi:hypothetical protein